jgi:hypothetical protein
MEMVTRGIRSELLVASFPDVTSCAISSGIIHLFSINDDLGNPRIEETPQTIFRPGNRLCPSFESAVLNLHTLAAHHLANSSQHSLSSGCI